MLVCTGGCRRRVVTCGFTVRQHRLVAAPSVVMAERMSYVYVFCSFVPLAVLGLVLEAAVFVFTAILQVLSCVL